MKRTGTAGDKESTMEDIKKESIVAFCKGAELRDAVASGDWRGGWNDAMAAIVWFVTAGEGTIND